jgi:Flp pilus assembly protein TadD
VIALLCALLAAGAAEPGLRLHRTGHDAQAAKELQAALRKDPRNAALATDLGFVYARLGQTAEAEKSYRLAISLSPARWYAYANLADLLATSPDRFRRADEIITLLDRGLALAAPSGRVSLAIHLADFERAAGRIAAARAWVISLQGGQLTPDQLRRLRELMTRIVDDERARSLADWPEPQPSDAQRSKLNEARALDAREALAVADALCEELPSWREARWLRAKSLEALGRDDEEARELRVLTQLAPSEARAWRRLGEILAQQGGLLEAGHADEALRQALALEPSWIELWILRAKVALRQGRAQDALRELQRYAKAGGTDPEALHYESLARALPERSQSPSALPIVSREPSPRARMLLVQAGAPEITQAAARDLLQQSLADSPTFIEAAAALVALGGTVPDSTVQALQADGQGLLELATQARRAGAAASTVAPWIDQAIQLGANEALLLRAKLRTNPQDALQDLRAYTAAKDPQELEEARSLRSQLDPALAIDVDALRARLRLAEDRPEAAIAALGGACVAGLSPERFVALGEAQEFAGELLLAADCYRLGDALPRLARVGERALLPKMAAELRKAEDSGIPAASWALARIELDAGHEAQALPHIEKFLQQADASDAGIAPARAARDRILRKTTAAALERTRRRAALALLSLGLVLAALAYFFNGRTVEAALRKSPRLFPAVSRAVGELRHDVLKHRASGLSMIAEPGAKRDDIARSLLSPEPASGTISRLYEDLRKVARAHGVRLRPLGREPVFGALVRDLAKAEWLVQQGSAEDLLRIDQRLREVHSARLAALLKLGPRTRIDAGAVSGWIRDVEAEARRGGAPWKAPSILLQRMEVEFPVERAALEAIFANLLRNAQAAAKGGDVIVRLGEERDAAGRNLTVLLVGDSAVGGVTLESIEQRESGRGLARVRDLVREWQGHVVVREEEPPWKKAVGACFPAPPA